MGDDTLINRSDGQVVDQEFFNLLNRVLEGDFVGRDSSGAPTPGQNLGTLITPWGNAYLTSLILDGSPIDPDIITSDPNRVISGRVRTTSNFPDYIRATGTAASFTLLAATINLLLDINGAAATFDSDIVEGGLTLAPATNNTCQVNNAALTGQTFSKNLGEDLTTITVDNMQSELTSRIFQFVSLLNQTTGEILYCFVRSTTELQYARRGFFFDDNGDPIERDVLNNNDVLQLLSTGFVFADVDGTTLDISYKTPVIGAVTPGTPAVGDYWFDTNENVWKRYNGSLFVQVERVFIGSVVMDTSNCVASRSMSFGKGYSNTNSITAAITVLPPTGLAFANKIGNCISVDAENFCFGFNLLIWSVFESPQVRTIDTQYYLYITEKGATIISNIKPYDQRGFLRGWYHPYNSWRCVAQIYNNTSDQFELVSEDESTLNIPSGPDPLDGDRITLSNNGATQIDFSGGVFTFDDNSSRRLAPALTKDISTTWAPGNAGGLDTGSVAANTWYYCYAIYNLADPRGGDYIFTATLGSPTLPAGYTKKRYIGAIRYQTTSIKPFFQYNKTFTWQTRNLEIDTATVSTTGALLTLLTPLGIEVAAQINVGIGNNVGAGGSFNYLLITSPDEVNSVPSRTLSTIRYQVAQRVQIDSIKTNTSSQIRYRGTYATLIAVGSGGDQFRVWTLGWKDNNLED